MGWQERTARQLGVLLVETMPGAVGGSGRATNPSASWKPASGVTAGAASRVPAAFPGPARGVEPSFAPRRRFRVSAAASVATAPDPVPTAGPPRSRFGAGAASAGLGDGCFAPAAAAGSVRGIDRSAVRSRFRATGEGAPAAGLGDGEVRFPAAGRVGSPGRSRAAACSCEGSLRAGSRAGFPLTALACCGGL